MVLPYVAPGSNADLKTYFPDVRPSPDPRWFEFSFAVAGGISTGAYIAGVFDFFVEALDAFAAEQAGNPAQTPTHKLRVANLTGTSAGGLSAALAGALLLKNVPHVYADAKWAALVQAGNKTGVQQPELNPLYSAWVQQVDLTKLLAAATPEETELSVFAPAPAAIGKTVLENLATQPARDWPTWAARPLDLRVLIGNLRGVPYTLTFEDESNPNAGERLTLHRDQVAFSISPDGADGAPDTYTLAGQPFNQGPVWSTFLSAAVASSAIPGVFAPVAVTGIDPAVYQWRDCYYDTRLQRPVLDQPYWETPPTTYEFTATDGGVFDNEPFDVAHRMLSGAQAVNARDGTTASRAVVLLMPFIDTNAGDPKDPILTPPPPPQKGETPPTPLSRLLSAAGAIFNSPIEQSRWDAFDLALIKSEAIFSRFLIAPSRESPNPAHPKKMMGPSTSLMSWPLHLGLGFASEAYRRHDYLLGRRNAQRFLSDVFMLPADNPIINTTDAWEATDKRTVTDATGKTTVYYPIVPLRGTAHQTFEEPLPRWDWEALTGDQINLLTNLFGGRVDNAWRQIKASLVTPSIGESFWARLGQSALLGNYLSTGWLWLRPTIVNWFKDQLTKAVAQLDPSAL
ncbi:MAG: patatin-like phospholipase family protein [Caulobacterales bacterium]